MFLHGERPFLVVRWYPSCQNVLLSAAEQSTNNKWLKLMLAHDFSSETSADSFLLQYHTDVEYNQSRGLSSGIAKKCYFLSSHTPTIEFGEGVPGACTRPLRSYLVGGLCVDLWGKHDQQFTEFKFLILHTCKKTRFWRCEPSCQLINVDAVSSWHALWPRPGVHPRPSTLYRIGYTDPPRSAPRV